MSLKKSLNQSLGKIRVAIIVEGGRKTQITDTTSTTLCILSVGALLALGTKLTDTMCVLLNATVLGRRHVIVDNVHNVVYIKPFTIKLACIIPKLPEGARALQTRAGSREAPRL